MSSLGPAAGQADLRHLGDTFGLCGWRRVGGNPSLRLLVAQRGALGTTTVIGRALSASGMEAIVTPDATECGGAVLPGIAFSHMDCSDQACASDGR